MLSAAPRIPPRHLGYPDFYLEETQPWRKKCDSKFQDVHHVVRLDRGVSEGQTAKAWLNDSCGNG